MTVNKQLTVKNINVNFFSQNERDYISLTDIARYKNAKEPKDIVKNWMRNRNTIEFLGLWEQINNPIFKGVEFDSFKKEAGLNAFVLSPQKWIAKTNAIGIISKSGRGGGTFAHKDIAFESPYSPRLCLGGKQLANIQQKMRESLKTVGFQYIKCEIQKDTLFSSEARK